MTWSFWTLSRVHTRKSGTTTKQQTSLETLTKDHITELPQCDKKHDCFGVLIDSIKPDIIMGTESFLIKDIVTPTELDAYNVERWGCDTCRGGVFIAAKDDLLLTGEYDLEIDCEVLWCKINIQSSRTLHIGSFYHPDVSDSTSLDELGSSHARIPTNHLVFLGGDLNLPDCDWPTRAPILKPRSKHPDHHTKLNDIIANHGLTQHITKPIRQDPHQGVSNTLDLIMTNGPSSVISSSVVPSISHHNRAVIELEVQPIRVTKNQDIPL